MKYKFLTGSKYLNLNTANDTDYAVIYVDETYEHRCEFDSDLKIDIHNQYLEDVLKYLNFEIELDAKSSTRYLHNVFLSQFINEIPNQSYNILEHKSEYKHFLLECKKHNYLNLDKKYAINIRDGKVSKLVYKVVYLLYIFQNNSYELTKEQLQTIQDIHDWKVSCDYLDTIYEMIDNL